MKNYTLKDLGFNETLAEYRQQNQLENFLIGRVILEHRERYVVVTEEGELESELMGNLRYAAQSRADFPVVGDWVAVQQYDEHKGLIHAVYPRKSILERQAVGKHGEKQPIASNIDVGIIVQSVNRDFNINRLERYITICNAAGIVPMIVLSKVDLLEPEVEQPVFDQVKARMQDIHVVRLSNLTGEGVEAIKFIIEPGKTYCLLGSSGVGKSSLINKLSGRDIMETGEISSAIDRGKHVTTHRELIVLDTGGVLIDNPGMREVGIADSKCGLEMTFDHIHALANQCKFNDCSHVNEKGCAVLAALDSGELNEESYENYMKLEREQARFTTSVYEKRKKEKSFGKMVREVIKQKNQRKFL